jgi:hypothetical protein
LKIVAHDVYLYIRRGVVLILDENQIFLLQIYYGVIWGAKHEYNNHFGLVKRSCSELGNE